MARLYPCLFAYDITENADRRRALRLLRAVADVYQDSVFDCRLDKASLQALPQQLEPLLSDTDSLLCIPLPPDTQSWQLGTGIEPLTAGILVIR